MGQIPGSVSRDQLQQLFPQATSISYRPGKLIRNRVKLGYDIASSVTYNFRSLCFFVITRFASLHFDDVLAATQVIEHKDQYYIHNQFLSISYKLLNNTTLEIDPDGQL